MGLIPCNHHRVASYSSSPHNRKPLEETIVGSANHIVSVPLEVRGDEAILIA
jgi:hypothetical protein